MGDESVQLTPLEIKLIDHVDTYLVAAQQEEAGPGRSSAWTSLRHNWASSDAAIDHAAQDLAQWLVGRRSALRGVTLQHLGRGIEDQLASMIAEVFESNDAPQLRHLTDFAASQADLEVILAKVPDFAPVIPIGQLLNDTASLSRAATAQAERRGIPAAPEQPTSNPLESIPGKGPTMTVSASLHRGTVEAVRSRVGRGEFSRYVESAVVAQIAQDNLREILDDYETHAGPPDPEQVAAARAFLLGESAQLSGGSAA